MKKNKKTELKKQASPPTSGIKRRSLPELSQYVAIVVFLILAVVLCVSVRYGLQNDDETTCIAGAHRIMFGELPLLENWTVIQLHAFVEYLPFRILYALLGGTEGIVLALRYVYVAVKMLFFAAICVMFRRYRYWAILAALIFTAYHPMDFQSLTYYNTSILCAFAVGWLLFINEKHTAPVLLAAGVLSGLCFLSEPLTALLWLGFTVTVAAAAFRKKRTGRTTAEERLAAPRKWLLVTAGIGLVACVVLAVTLCAGDLKTVLATAPRVLRSLEFRPQTDHWRKYSIYFFQTGVAGNAAAGLLLVLIFVCKAVKRVHKYRVPLFICACAVFVWLTAEMFLRTGLMRSAVYMTPFKPLPLCFLGLVSYLLSERKNKKLFAFFLFGLAFSVCMDLSSMITFFAGGIVSVPAAVLLFRQALLECRADVRLGERKETGDRALQTAGRVFYHAACVLCVGVLVVSEVCYCLYARFYPSPEALGRISLTEQIDRGPLKGLYTIPKLKEKYDAVLADMDSLQAEAPDTLLVMDYLLWGNLYLDLPYAAPTPDSYSTLLSRENLFYYWEMFPEKRPDAVYIPFFGCDDYLDHTALAEDNLAFMQSICECEVQTGEMGYLLKILSWN